MNSCKYHDPNQAKIFVVTYCGKAAPRTPYPGICVHYVQNGRHPPPELAWKTVTLCAPMESSTTWFRGYLFRSGPLQRLESCLPKEWTGPETQAIVARILDCYCKKVFENESIYARNSHRNFGVHCYGWCIVRLPPSLFTTSTEMEIHRRKNMGCDDNPRN